MALYYREYGGEDSPLMVFIHGGGVSGWMWDKQIAYFINYHCLVPDLPGQGRSSSEELFTIKGSAEEIADLIVKKGNGKPVIAIGFSLGAQVLVALLSLHPHLIDYAIINSALVRPFPFPKVFAKSLIIAHPLVKNKAFSNIQAKSMYIDPAYRELYYEESRELSKSTFVQIMIENMSFTIPEHFKHSSSKILATVGDKENSMMKKSVRDLVKHSPNCTGIVIPKTGHGVSLQRPDFFNKLVDEWVTVQRLPEEAIIV
ncbi:MAG: alpha/beta fold hydrolase [Bacillus sp. (in: firmicutes)]